MNSTEDTIDLSAALAPSEGDSNHEGTPDGECELVRRMEAEDLAAQKLEDRYRTEWRSMRDYVAGTQQNTYTVQTNVIAPKLNAVLPYIYARDPEPDCRPSEAVDASSYKDVQAFTRTLQVVIKRDWSRNRRQLKRAAKRMVRSAQTVGLGYFKAAICTDTISDPLMLDKVNTLQDNLKTIDSLIAQDQTGDTPDDLAFKREQILLQMRLAQAGVERQVAKGMVINRVRSDDLLVCPSVGELQDYAIAPWIRENIFMPAGQAERQFNLTKDQLAKAKVYRMRGEKNDATPTEVEGGQVGKNTDEIDWVCIRERWSMEDGYVYQWLAGCDYLLSPAAPPQFPTERFYPYFQLGYNWVDDRRYPISDVSNMRALQDEFSARRSAARTWRERSKPGLVINGQAMDTDDVKRLTATDIGENVVLQSMDPTVSLANAVIAKPIPQMDLAMLDVGDILRELEMVSGAQDAATGVVTTAKTATEAEIVQGSNQAKGSEKVDTLDDLMSDFAVYSAQQAIQAYSLAEAQRMAGRGAVWPSLTLDELLDNVTVEVQAGSMGKPNTTQQQQGWSQIFPLISQTADQIAQLEAPTAQPNPPPMTGITLTPPTPEKLALAEAKRALLKETVRRFDERIDVDQFLPPKPGDQAAVQPTDPMGNPLANVGPGAPVASGMQVTNPSVPVQGITSPQGAATQVRALLDAAAHEPNTH